jgi:roadblock/LC7 domain-containing protein
MYLRRDFRRKNWGLCVGPEVGVNKASGEYAQCVGSRVCVFIRHKMVTYVQV